MYTVSVFKHNNLKIIILTLLCDIHWHVDLSLTIQLLCDILRILLRHFCGTWKFGVELVSSASVQCEKNNSEHELGTVLLTCGCDVNLSCRQKQTFPVVRSGLNCNSKGSDERGNTRDADQESMWLTKLEITPFRGISFSFIPLTRI
jgi:hypothetical protein